MGIGWGVAFQVFLSRFPKGESTKFAHFMFWGIFISSWIGSKLLFIWTLPSGALSEIDPIDFWTGGGFVFYGGFLAALTFILVLKIVFRKLNLSHLAPLVPALVFGHAIGRVGCFLAGCCYGKMISFFMGSESKQYLRHPTQLYEAIFLFGLGYFFVKKELHPKHQIIFYFLSYGVFRFFLEFLRDDKVRGFWLFMTPSQWISVFIIIMALSFNYYSEKSNA